MVTVLQPSALGTLLPTATVFFVTGSTQPPVTGQLSRAQHGLTTNVGNAHIAQVVDAQLSTGTHASCVQTSEARPVAALDAVHVHVLQSTLTVAPTATEAPSFVVH
jgi:hypothetical protein